jgi:hypothetical protein
MMIGLTVTRNRLVRHLFKTYELMAYHPHTGSFRLSNQEYTDSGARAKLTLS